MKTVIVYGTVYGSTKTCAEYVKSHLDGACEVIQITKRTKLDLTDYDRVVIGTPIYMGKILKEVMLFCDKYENELLEKQVGIFLVCTNLKNLNNHFLYNFSFELLDVAKIRGGFGGIVDESKLKFFHRMVTRAVRAQSPTVKVPKSELRYDKMDEFCQYFEHPEKLEQEQEAEKIRLEAEKAERMAKAKAEVAARREAKHLSEMESSDSSEVAPLPINDEKSSNEVGNHASSTNEVEDK